LVQSQFVKSPFWQFQEGLSFWGSGARWTGQRPFSIPISHQPTPLSRSRIFAAKEGKRPLSTPPTQPTNGRSPPQSLINHPHSVGLEILLLRKPNGRSPITTIANQQPFLAPTCAPTSRTQSVSTFCCTGRQTAVSHLPVQSANGRFSLHLVG